LTSSTGNTVKTSRAVKALFLSPIVVLFASAVRLLLISNYDTSTATLMASSGGIIGTLLGTVVPLLPAFLPALLVLVVIFRRWRLAILTGLAVALVSPAYEAPITIYRQARTEFLSVAQNINELDFLAVWEDNPWAIGCALAALLVMVFFDAPNWLDWGESGLIECVLILIGRLLFGLGPAVICGVCVLLVQIAYQVPFNTTLASDIVRRPWLPAEKVSVQSGETPIIAYTLSTADGWHVLLTERTRRIYFIKASDIIAREVCQVDTQQSDQPLPLIRFTGVIDDQTESCGI